MAAARRRLARGVLGGLCVMVAGVVFGAGSASAALTHAFSSSFGSFSGVEGIAVDSSTGDVYVYDAGAGEVLKFDGSGSPGNFSATGTNAIEGVGSVGEGEGEIAVDSSAGPASGDIYVADGSHVGVYSATGESLGELVAEAGRPWGTPCGVAVDSAGDVYVGLRGSRVNKYAPSGNPVTGNNYVGSLWGLSNACGLAVDGEGAVYVDAWPEGPVFKYEALQFNALETTASGVEVTGNGRAVAIDPSSNDLFVARYGEVAQYEPTGGLIDSFSGMEANAFGNVHGLAVDGSGDVLVSDNNQGRIDVFGPAVLLADATIGEATSVSRSGATLRGTVNPNGLEVASCRFEYSTYEEFYQASTAPCVTLPGSGSSPVPVEADVAGLAPRKVYYYRLVAADANGVAYSQRGQFKTQSLPIVESVSATEVNRSTARIDAVINPAGTDTTYRFEYGPDISYGSSFPVPDGDLGSADENVEVNHFLTGLQPGSTYHFRIVATSAVGTTTTEDHTFSTFPAPAPEPTDTCPNAAYRVGASQGLPDCRAYEMVSPVDKGGAEVAGDAFGQTFAPEFGETGRVVFMSKTGFGEVEGSGASGFTQYLAERGPAGWSTHGITPTPNTSVATQVSFDKTDIKQFSPDLAVGALMAYTLPEGPAGARPHSENEYLEDTTTGKAFATITDASHEGEPAFPSTDPFAFWGEIPVMGGASSSLDVVTFMSRVNYLPEAKGSESKVYAYDHGVLELVGRLPDGSIPPAGSELVHLEHAEEWAPRPIEEKDTVSADGSRILFVVPEFPHQLFMRKNGSTTVLVSKSETTTPVVAEDVRLEAATPDLKHIVFDTATRLLDSAPEGGGLYMYTDSPSPKSESNLTYIGGSGLAPSEAGDTVLGMSEDGTHIYVADGASVYLWDSGQTRRIAPTPGVKPAHGLLSVSLGYRVEGRVTPDGSELAFMAPEQLTGAPVSPAVSEIHSNDETSEMYVYKESSNTLTCVSCPGTGATATVGIETEVRATRPRRFGLRFAEPYRPRFMSRDGRYVFFNTPEALVAQDTNGVTDAYEYDTVTGKLSLLSTGTGESGVWFVDASADGHDVFLVTRAQLSRWDPDKLADLYDVRVDGGFPEPPVPGLPCDGDACQGTPSGAPSFNTASGFVGLGNPSFSEPAAVKAKAKPSERLRRALAGCHRKPRRKRARCEGLARRRYGTGRSSVRNRRAGR